MANVATVKLSYGSSWYDASAVPASKRPTLDTTVEADVCIIGGGLTGLTAAYELLKLNRTVVLLEAERIACKASGRNGGFVIPGFALGHEELIESIGSDAAHQLWALSIRGVEYVSRAISQTGMKGINPTAGLLLVSRRNDLAAAKAEAATYRELGTPANVWDTQQVRHNLASNAYFQAIELPNAFHIHPLNYALGLADAVERAGGLVFEESPARAFCPKKMRVQAGTGGSVCAQHVILAQGTSAKPLIRQAQSVMPIVSHVGVTQRLDCLLHTNVRFGGAVLDSRVAPTYYRHVDGDRLLWGGPVTFGVPERERLVHMIKADIAKDYPELAKIEISYVWSGEMAYVHHKMPTIGEIAPGVWILNAFGGHGLNTTAMAGELVANAIALGATEWKQFAPFSRGFALPGQLGRIAAYAAYVGQRFCEQLGI